MDGWRCPVCRHVYAPTVTECSRCGNEGTATVSPFQPFTPPGVGSGGTINVDPKAVWRIWYPSGLAWVSIQDTGSERAAS